MIPMLLLKKLGGPMYISKATVTLENCESMQNIESFFWKTVIKTYLNFTNFHLPNTNLPLQEVGKEPIFNNAKILYKKKPICLSNWIKGGIKYVEQLWSGQNMKNINEVRNQIGNYGGLILDYFAVVNAIKTEWKNEMRENHREIVFGKF